MAAGAADGVVGYFYTPDECRSQLAAYRGLVDEVVLHTPATPPLTSEESADAFPAILRIFGS